MQLEEEKLRADGELMIVRAVCSFLCDSVRALAVARWWQR